MNSPSWGGIGSHTKPLEVLWADGERLFCRTWRGDPRQLVLAVLPAAEHPTPATLDRFANEYGLKDHLESTWAARPVELIREHGRTMLLLECPGSASLDHLIGSPIEMGKFLRLAVAISATLCRLHERGLIHKDIKPTNVLVNVETMQTWLTGFGVATRSPREQQSPEPPEVIPGTLAYMAPEQTGRMSRSIDSRSDLYSFGVMLYQMLTGTLPFTALDPMEWVHCHIARVPPAPAQRSTCVPATLSAIILKLLAKIPEERYQTAAGVEHDLQRCLTEWETLGRVSDFAPGQHDVPDRLLIPERLYGRAREMELLFASFRRVVATGDPELVSLSGYSGIGKSSVVNELNKVVTAQRCLFAAGKFDQYKRDIPYAPLAGAFQSLVRLLLGRSQAELQGWRDAIQNALDPNGRLLLDLVPELQLVIGEQPPVPDLPLTDAQHRFHLLLRRFIAVFARPGQPLVMFLDDLQWLDLATIEFLEDLLSHPEVRHLLLVGAHRDNEVSADHPLLSTLESIRKSGTPVRSVVLAPLTAQDLQQLIADSLHCEPERVVSLAQLVREKTGGNPFFAIQFLTALAEEGLLRLERREARWSWDPSRIHGMGYSDNVVDLMVGKLQRMPAETRNALQRLACLGNSADLTLLHMVCPDMRGEIHEQLREAVRTGLVMRAEGSYRFPHDRVREAAYALIPEELRAGMHLHIGRRMAAETAPDKWEERIFEIVNHINRALDLITSDEERKRAAELNLVAARRAKTSTAYAAALHYLRPARASLTDSSWNHSYELIFSIEFLTAECELLTAELHSAESRLSLLAERARTAHDIAAVSRLRLTLYTALDRSDRGVEVCLEYLRRGGTNWPAHPSTDEVRREYEQIWSRLGNREIEELLDLPRMTNPDVLDTLEVLTEIVTPAVFFDQNLCSLAICRMVNLSLEHGNSDGSCFAYVWFGIITGPRFGNHRDGFRFGRLGYDLVEGRGLRRYQARTYMSFGNLVLPWVRHAREGQDLVRRAFDAAHRVGDFTFAAYSLEQLITNLLVVGDPLPEVQAEAERGLAFARTGRFGLVIDLIASQLQLVRTLRGSTRKFGYFDDEQFDETGFEQHLASNPVLADAEFGYWALKAQARFLAGDYASAVNASLRAQPLLWSAPSLLEPAGYRFFSALSHAALWDCAPPEQKAQHLEALRAHCGEIEMLAEHCPANFADRAALVGAELARIEGRTLDAVHLYEQAIRAARDNGFVHGEGIASEVAGRFYLSLGLEINAYAHLRNALACFGSWGAEGKLTQLRLLYPRLVAADARQATAALGASLQQPDVAAVIKASQVLSSEIALPRLVERLMTITLQNAGADRGLLVLPRADEYRVAAEAIMDGAKLVLRHGSAVDPAAPGTIVRYVVRSKDKVLLEDAAKPNQFSEDDYLCARKPRSLLCLPLVRQGVLGGVLYLENTLASHAFTPSRTALLEMVSSQAAISLENTRLYSDLQEREAKVRRLVDANIIGIFIWDLQGRIVDANEAFLRIIGYSREDLVSGRMNWRELTPHEWRAADDQHITEVKEIGTVQPFEKEFRHKNGNRVPVLVGGASFEGERDEGVAFVLDLTDRKRAEQAAFESERRYREVEVALAHANRVATLGQLSASIAHEIKQPVAAAVTNAQAALRWLGAQPPNIGEAMQATSNIVKNGNRAGEVISRIRALVKKAPQKEEWLEVNEAIREVIALIHGEVVKNGVSVQTQLAQALPPVQGDKVQLQQVVLNLVMNSLEAMSGVALRSRELLISTAAAGSDVLVTVRDSGPGFAREDVDRVFEAFYTTKPGGLGLGLSICNSIIQAHGGRLWASGAEVGGATLQFTLPAPPDSARVLESRASGSRA